jgi:hypothetical protein
VVQGRSAKDGDRVPPRPSAAETARTLTAGQGTASLSTAFGSSAAPVLHAGLEDGEVAVLVGRRELTSVGLGDVLAPAGEPRVVLVDIRSYAPLPDLTLARAQLCAAGHARAAQATERGAAGVALRTVYGSAVDPLVTGDPDRVLLIVDVADCELHWPEGCERIPATDYVLADSDPLAHDEGAALQRIADACSARLLAMVRGLRRDQTGDDDLTRAVAVRPVGLDRYGLTLQCSLADGDAGLGRLAFPAPVEDVAEAEGAIRGLLDQHEYCRSLRP